MINRLFQFWINLPEKVRFLLIGGWNTFFSLTCFSIVFLILKNYKISLIIAHFLSVLQSFISFRTFVFFSKGDIIKEYLKINLVYLVYFALNFLLILFFVEILKIYPIIAQFLITCILIVFSYLSNKYFTFK